MEQESALIVVAEIAVAIAGFSGIAAALRHGNAPNWPAGDRERFIQLVSQSGIALFASLTPLIFAHKDGLGPELWSGSSFYWAGFGSIGIGLSLARGTSGGDLRQRVESVVILSLFACMVLFQLYNGLVLKSFWPYLTGLVINLAFAFYQFMALAIPKPAD